MSEAREVAAPEDDEYHRLDPYNSYGERYGNNFKNRICTLLQFTRVFCVKDLVHHIFWDTENMFVRKIHKEDCFFVMVCCRNLQIMKQKRWWKNIWLVRHILIHGYCLNCISIIGMDWFPHLPYTTVGLLINHQNLCPRVTVSTKTLMMIYSSRVNQWWYQEETLWWLYWC